MAATQLLTKVSTQGVRAFNPRLIAASASSGFSPARNNQVSGVHYHQRLSRHSVATTALPSWVPFIGKQRKQVISYTRNVDTRLEGCHSRDSIHVCLEPAAGLLLVAVPTWLAKTMSSLGLLKTLDHMQGNNSVLNWARTTRMACQVAPGKAPAGQDIATFAGKQSRISSQTLQDNFPSARMLHSIHP